MSRDVLQCPFCQLTTCVNAAYQIAFQALGSVGFGKFEMSTVAQKSQIFCNNSQKSQNVKEISVDFGNYFWTRNFTSHAPTWKKTNQQKRRINLFKQVSMSLIGIGKPFCKLPTFVSNSSMARCATSVEASSNTCSMEASWGPSSREGVGDGKGVGGEGHSTSDVGSLSLWPLLLNGNCSKFNEQNLNTKLYILSSWKRCYLMLPSPQKVLFLEILPRRFSTKESKQKVAVHKAVWPRFCSLCSFSSSSSSRALGGVRLLSLSLFSRWVVAIFRATITRVSPSRFTFLTLTFVIFASPGVGLVGRSNFFFNSGVSDK